MSAQGSYASCVLTDKYRAVSEPFVDAEAHALALESVPALAARSVYNIALAMQRVAEGDETVDVRALLKVLERAAERTASIVRVTLESDARRGGTLGRLRKAARDAGTVERDRAEGDVLRSELTAAHDNTHTHTHALTGVGLPIVSGLPARTGTTEGVTR